MPMILKTLLDTAKIYAKLHNDMYYMNKTDANFS